jgi:hypothetical protein
MAPKAMHWMMTGLLGVAKSGYAGGVGAPDGSV